MRSHGALEAKIGGHRGAPAPPAWAIPAATERIPSRVPGGGDTSCPGGGHFAGWWHQPPPQKCPRGRRWRPVPSRLLPGVENIPSCAKLRRRGSAPGAPPQPPGRAPAPVPPFPGGDRAPGRPWGLPEGRAAEEVPERERPRSHHKGRKRSGGNQKGTKIPLQSPPRVPPDPSRGLWASFPPPFPAGSGDFSGGHGGTSAALSGEVFGGHLVGIAHGCSASPGLCPGFPGLRGIGMSRRGLILAGMGWVEQLLVMTGHLATLGWHVPPG